MVGREKAAVTPPVSDKKTTINMKTSLAAVRSISAFSFFSDPLAKTESYSEPQTENKLKLHRVNTRNAVFVLGEKPTTFQGETYQMLTHDLPIVPHMKLSCRGGAREEILVNLDSSILNKTFNEFIQELKLKNQDCEPTQPLEDTDDIGEPVSLVETKQTQVKMLMPEPYDMAVLRSLVQFVRSKLRASSEQKIQELVKQEQVELNLKTRDNVAMLEWFWKHQAGYCRHRALAVVQLLVTLIDSHAAQNGKNFAETKTQVYRFRTMMQPLDSSKQPLGHAVVIYEAENGHRYLLDPSMAGFTKNGIVANLSAMGPEEKRSLANQYKPFNGKVFLTELMEVYNNLRISSRIATKAVMFKAKRAKADQLKKTEGEKALALRTFNLDEARPSSVSMARSKSGS